MGPRPSPGVTRLRASRFPYAYGLEALRLATTMHSPARVSRRSMRPWYPRSTPIEGSSRGLPFQAAHVCYRPVSGAFHPPPGVLFTFRSRYWCAIGLRTYLALEADGPQLPTPYPRCGTRELGHHPSHLLLRGFHPLRRPIPGHFGSMG